MSPAEWTRRIDAWDEREERQAKERITLAYMTAFWGRTNKLKSLEEILNPPPEAEELTDEESQRQAAMVDYAMGKLDVLKARAAARKKG